MRKCRASVWIGRVLHGCTKVVLGKMDQWRRIGDVAPLVTTIEELLQHFVSAKLGVIVAATEKTLKHAFTTCNDGGILFCLALFRRVVGESVLGWNGRDDDSRMQAD